MPRTSAELRLNDDFNDVCHLLIRRPHVLLPATATKVDDAEWRILRRAGTRVWRRPIDILVTLEQVTILDNVHATMKLRWRLRHRRSDDGNATIYIDALSRPPSPCTLITLAIERPAASRLRVHLTQRRTVNDLLQLHVRHLAEALSAQCDAFSDQISDDDLRVPRGWTDEHQARKEHQ